MRVDGRQILLLRTPDRIFACPNRCPHEGYPLSEGDCSDDGALRCNWHNWTFDLVSGKTLVGEEALQNFPVKVDGERLLIHIDDDRQAAQQRALDGTRAALDEADLPRLLRESARLENAGGDRDNAVRVSITWLAPRLKYGTTHAIAGAADWLALADRPELERAQRLAAVGEILGHIADDGRRERSYGYTERADPWDPAVFRECVERGDEASALACVNGALAEGARIADLSSTLAACALAHYADFGHSLIYVVKTAELAARLGPATDAPLLAMLVRSLCYAKREDLLPQFRDYAGARTRWPQSLTASIAGMPPILVDASITQALEYVTENARLYSPESILRALVDSAAVVLRSVDEEKLRATHGSLAKNVTWLDFTHAITFADAGANVVRDSPELWPDVLMQLACFIGRSHGFTDAALAASSPPSVDAAVVFAQLRDELFDHGRERFIGSVHLIKTLFAAERLVNEGLAEPWLLATALERYFHARTKGRHVIRTARQMLAVVSEA